MEEQNVVNESPLTKETPEQEVALTEVVDETPAPTPGSKTDSELLLKSLQEEREKRRELEAQLKAFTSAPAETPEVFSDEGKALKKLIDDQNTKMATLEEQLALEKLYTQFPELKKSATEFMEYKSDFPASKLEGAAKLFLAEKGISAPARKGLEKPVGGTKTPSITGIKSEDLADLRKNDFKKYLEVVKKLDANDIK